MRFVDLDGWAAVLSLQGVLVACMPAQSNRGLERELQAARAEAAVEQRRVYELEARLARLEYHAEQPPATPVANPAGGDPTVQRQLDALIALNQELLREVQANRERTALAAPAVAPPAPVPAVLTPPAAAQQSQTASTLGPECNTGLTTEQRASYHSPHKSNSFAKTCSRSSRHCSKDSPRRGCATTSFAYGAISSDCSKLGQGHRRVSPAGA